MITKIKILGILIGIFAFFQLLEAKQIGSETQLDWVVQAERFLRMDDPSIQRVIVGCLIMGVSCGLIGSYVVTRRLSSLAILYHRHPSRYCSWIYMVGH